MGAHFQLDIHEASDLSAFLGGYRGQGIVTALDASTSLYAANLKHPIAWVFGSEGLGVKEEVIEAARLKVRIPMPGTTESLNVAAAAAICLFCIFDDEPDVIVVGHDGSPKPLCRSDSSENRGD